MICKYSTLVFLWITIVSFSYGNDQWKLVEETSDGDLKIRLKVKEHPNPFLKEWLSLEFINSGTEDLPIEKLNYRFEFKAYFKGGVKEGRFSSDHLENFSDNNQTTKIIAASHLPQGIFTSSESLSILAANQLGYPYLNPVKVRAQLYLDFEIGGKKNWNINWPEIEFSFMWYPPTKEEEANAAEEFIKLLYQAQSTPLRDQRMECFIENPQLANKLELTTLIKATQIRKGKSDGRLPIVRYMNTHFSEKKRLQEHYRQLIFKKDLQAVKDLTIATDIWNDNFLEPIISWFQEGNSGVMIQLMEMMYAHRKNWIQKEGINMIFSDLILYRYEDIIHKPHYELTDRELLIWASAAQLLGKTGNPEVREILLPFLKCTTAIPTGTLLNPSGNTGFPEPLRIADIALEGLYQLEGKNLESIYLNAGYQFSFDKQETTLNITRTRDILIDRILSQQNTESTPP